ncbi:MAG: ribonuclease HII [Candidatus Aenigmatarchaeota archaeon]
MATILGIDEAGRGAVIGPLVIAGVVIDEKDSKVLAALGVKDSKLLTPDKREALAPNIKRIAKDWIILKISAKEIDALRERINLNKIEAEKIAEIIRAAKADTAIIDTPQVSVSKFKTLLEGLVKNKTKIIAENYADKKYPVCSAASILAKVERDAEVRKIEKEHGIKVRTGYPHDPETIEFLKRCKGHYPDFVRKSWATVIELNGKSKQKSLGEF